MAKQKHLSSNSPSETERIGVGIGAKLRGGEVIELKSDVGGGKTTFVRGLAKGFGSSDHVSSPTFTVSNRYDNGRQSIYHFDFYRLHEPGIIKHELEEAIDSDDAVIVVEWGDAVQRVLPPDRLQIEILSQAGENARKLICKYPGSYAYLLEEA